MTNIKLSRYQDIKFEDRKESSEGIAKISWVQDESHIRCGFGQWDRAKCEPKTLTYDEVLFIVKGKFGVEVVDGERIEASEGDVISIPQGTCVRYFGEDAIIFFAIK